MPYLKCGYSTSYLNDIRDKLKEADTDNEHYKTWIEDLCTFRYEERVSNNNGLKNPADLPPILAVLENIFCRGLPTLPSLRVERAITESINQGTVFIEEKTIAGSFSFTYAPYNKKQNKDWLNAIASAHILIDPTWKQCTEDTDLLFDSYEERVFYQDILPEIIDAHLIQLVEPQRPIASMGIMEQMAELYGQVVDFAIEVDGIKGIIEIDGSQHLEHAQRSLDKKRDEILDKLGWKTVRIPTHFINERKLGEIKKMLALLFGSRKTKYLSSIEENYNQPLWERPFGKEAMQLVLVPYAVARFHKLLLTAIRNGVLQIDDPDWKIVVIERDIQFAQLAIVDFLEALTSLKEIADFQWNLPSIELVIYESSLSKQFEPIITDQGGFSLRIIKRDYYDRSVHEYNADLIVDLSLLQRYGMAELDQDFYESHLASDGAAYCACSGRYQDGHRRVQTAPPITYWHVALNAKSLQYFLQNIFRKEKFRDGQVKILQRSLSLEPVIGLLPTGAGKSLCYQLAALLQPGVTIIIDPLRSLMFDQVDNLKKNLIDNINYINSEQSGQERDEVVNQMSMGGYQMVFMSPERLQIKSFREALTRMTVTNPIPYVVIDEAHCVSEWGHDFRTSYLNLGQIVREFCKHEDLPPTIIALTGTASFAVLTDVQREIDVVDEEAKIEPDTFDRKELNFGVHVVPSSNKFAQLIKILRQHIPKSLGISPEMLFQSNGRNTYSGLIFTPHANGKNGFDVSSRLQEELGKKKVRFYSGSRPKKFEIDLQGGRKSENLWNAYKKKVQESYKANEFPLLVATKAFGMGIDKSNIRYTIHYNMPQSLEAFYQEAGRAGRDSQAAYCLLIFSDDQSELADKLLDLDHSVDELEKIKERGYGDIHRMLWFHTNSFQGTRSEKMILLKILEDVIYPNSKRMENNEAQEILIPFRDKDMGEDEREKAIYRLSLIGVVEDYTKDYHKRLFEVTLVKQEEGKYLEHLLRYIARYKTREYSTRIKEQFVTQNGRNEVEKCLGILIEFIYEEVEKKRRTAIAQMADVARKNHSNEDFRSELLAYLEKSPFTKPLQHLAERMAPHEWWEITDQVVDIDTARQLLGGCRRTLESYPDHPGLLFLNGFSRLMLSNESADQGISEIVRGASQLKQLLVGEPERQVSIVLELVDVLEKKSVEFLPDLGDLLLDEFPERPLAIKMISYSPIKAEKILVNDLLHRTTTFSSNYLQETD
jgi:ATP-dependent DNA helicase RecQ